MGFLTVEDINSALFNEQGFYWHSIETSLISSDDFENVRYDFCEVSKETNENYITYVFRICADNWAKGVRVEYNGQNITPNSIDLISDYLVITVSTDYPHITVYLYMGDNPYNNVTLMHSYLRSDKIGITYDEIGETTNVLVYTNGSTDWSDDIVKTIGNVPVTWGNANQCGYILFYLMKTEFGFNCTQNLTIGKINKVKLGTRNDYKPNGSSIGEYEPKITIYYKNTPIQAYWDRTANDYCFDLDLKDKTSIGSVNLEVEVEANEVIEYTSRKIRLNSDYQIISTFQDLKNACSTNGNNIFKIGSNITVTSDIMVNHPIKIIGNQKTINLSNSYKFILSEDITAKIEDLSIINGKNAIFQKKNTNLTILNCTFRNCSGFGAVISCDIDYNSLETDNDFKTTLNDCLFENNNTCIVHGGELVITGCKYHNNDYNWADLENVGFLYQIDGNAVIKNSVFDIDYDTDYFCQNEINLGFGSALLHCGLTSSINGADIGDLKENDTLPFFNNTYNNQSHVFIKYYYQPIEECVFISPKPSKEAECLCYCVSNDNTIYTENIQTTRANWGLENRTRKIIW